METVMKVLVGIMAVIFIISLVGTFSIPYDGTVSHSLVGIPTGSTALMLSLLGTTASLGTCAWGSSLAKDNEAMKMAAADALSGLIGPDELNADYIIPAPFDPRVGRAVAAAVAQAARDSGVARIPSAPHS